MPLSKALSVPLFWSSLIDVERMQVVTAWQAAMYRAFYDDYRKGTPAATATATATAGAAKPK